MTGRNIVFTPSPKYGKDVVDDIRIIVCGSRDWNDWDVLEFSIPKNPPTATIFQGEARGADRMAKKVALDHGYDVVGYYANWVGRGKSAGPVRNEKMFRAARPHYVIGFHENLRESKGTRHMAKLCLKHDVPFYYIRNIEDAGNFYNRRLEKLW